MLKEAKVPGAQRLRKHTKLAVFDYGWIVITGVGCGRVFSYDCNDIWRWTALLDFRGVPTWSCSGHIRHAHVDGMVDCYNMCRGGYFLLSGGSCLDFGSTNNVQICFSPTSFLSNIVSCFAFFLVPFISLLRSQGDLESKCS